jgi:hypothetical protein
VREVRLKAFVLIQTRPGAARIGAALRALSWIEWADDLAGAHDAIALVRADSMHDLMERVVPSIGELLGVTRARPAPLVGSVLHPIENGEEAV